MASYYTQAKARSDLEGEELEQRDVALVATTSTSASILPVGLYDASTGESESVSAETAGPATTHPELSPAGDHPSVGGRGILGSADSPLVGVTTTAVSVTMVVLPPWDTPVHTQTHSTALSVAWLVQPRL